MTDPLPAAHAAVCGPDGFTDHTHPDPDHDGCDFAAYLATDFPDPHESMFGPWTFYWMGEYWNGTPTPA